MLVAAQFLDHFCPSVRFLDFAPAQDSARGLIFVALDSDQMPRTVARVDPALVGQRTLYVQLHDLSYELQQVSESMSRGTSSPIPINPTVEITRRETVEVINGILRSFAGVAARAVPRVPASGGIEIVCGFYRAWGVLNDGSGAKSYPVEHAEVVNQTITGVAFRLGANVNVQLKVGEIILFRRPTQPIWRISVARWVEAKDIDGLVTVGCQAIGLRSDAYTAADADGIELPIIVAQVPNHVGDTTVLVPDHGAAEDAQLTTIGREQNSTILLTDLRETHVECARYHFLTV
jgi:hypothetical protein